MASEALNARISTWPILARIETNNQRVTTENATIIIVKLAEGFPPECFSMIMLNNYTYGLVVCKIIAVTPRIAAPTSIPPPKSKRFCRRLLFVPLGYRRI